ncbi:MAG: hypothetical protein R2874_03070 [Desulfobacterales bacterium]
MAEDFKKLELRAIKKAATGEVAAILNRRKKTALHSTRPNPLPLPINCSMKPGTYITDHPYAKDEIYEMARHNLFMTCRALAIADHSKAIATMPPEEIAFYIEDTLGEILGGSWGPRIR